MHEQMIIGVCVCVCLCVSCIDICYCWKKEDRVKVRVSYINICMKDRVHLNLCGIIDICSWSKETRNIIHIK